MAPSKIARAKKSETYEPVVKKKYYKSKQEETGERERNRWNHMFNLYYDHMEYHCIQPSVNSTCPMQKELALWVIEQEDNFKNIGLGYINIMSDKSIYNTWKEHRPTSK
jgi:hypothetical protein